MNTVEEKELLLQKYVNQKFKLMDEIYDIKKIEIVVEELIGYILMPIVIITYADEKTYKCFLVDLDNMLLKNQPKPNTDNVLPSYTSYKGPQLPPPPPKHSGKPLPGSSYDWLSDDYWRNVLYSQGISSYRHPSYRQGTSYDSQASSYDWWKKPPKPPKPPKPNSGGKQKTLKKRQKKNKKLNI